MAAAHARIFFGNDGKLRFFWRAILFAGGTFVLLIAVNLFSPNIETYFHLAGLSSAAIALNEVQIFIVVLLCTGIFARYERRRIGSYGLPIKKALSSRTFEGFAAGIVIAAAVALGMLIFGGMQLKGLALTGHALEMSALAWLGANVCVGIAEEFWFRSYLLQTLWKSIGFWPASIAIASIFAALHYFLKDGENVWDVITLVSLSLLLSYSMLRTGTLWFAVGFHIAFDYMQFFVIGTPNGARIPEGRMLNITFNGPAWLTGGVLGTEASFLMYPAIALLWLYIWWRNRGKPPLEVQ